MKYISYNGKAGKVFKIADNANNDLQIEFINKEIVWICGCSSCEHNYKKITEKEYLIALVMDS